MAYGLWLKALWKFWRFRKFEKAKVLSHWPRANSAAAGGRKASRLRMIICGRCPQATARRRRHTAQRRDADGTSSAQRRDADGTSFPQARRTAGPPAQRRGRRWDLLRPTAGTPMGPPSRRRDAPRDHPPDGEAAAATPCRSNKRHLFDCGCFLDLTFSHAILTVMILL